MCTSPISIKYNSIEGNHSKLVPCGKCFECLKTKQNDYFVRIYEELTHCSKACFITLTYAPKNVPYFFIDGKKYLTVWKQDVKDWLKRFRTNYERNFGKKIGRYFLCSEYGTHTHRPHYHAIFFNMSVKDMSLALRDWRGAFGFVMAKDIDMSSQKSLENSARYVAKYSTKGVFENPFRLSDEGLPVLPSFQQRFGSFICESYAVIPHLFYLSDDSSLRWKKWFIRYSGDKAVFRNLSGRGVKTEMRFNR